MECLLALDATLADGTNIRFLVGRSGRELGSNIGEQDERIK